MSTIPSNRSAYFLVRIKHERPSDLDESQGGSTIYSLYNGAWTMIGEFKHVTGQTHSDTSIVREYPQGDWDPYYLAPHAKSEMIYRCCVKLTSLGQLVALVGRTTQHRHCTTDEIGDAALTAAENLPGRSR